jgi:hypothetical protein
MDWAHFDAQALVDHGKLAFAALCGGVVRLLFKPASSLMKTVWMLACCVTCGFYGTAPVADWLNLNGDYRDATAAVIGLVGLSFAEGTLKAIDAFNLKDWLLKLLDRGPQT